VGLRARQGDKVKPALRAVAWLASTEAGSKRDGTTFMPTDTRVVRSGTGRNDRWHRFRRRLFDGSGA